MSDSVEFLRSEDLQDDSRWYSDAQGCTYVNYVYFGGNDVQCDGKCLNVLSVSTFLTQGVDTSLITPAMTGKTFILSFRALARQVSATAPGSVITINATDGFSARIFTMPLTAQSDTSPRFTTQRLEFTLPAEAKNGMNITMKLRDPTSPNNATLYFDELSFKPDAVLVQVKQETPIGAIVGGAVGGVALLIALGIICFLCMRKKKRAQKKKEKPEGIMTGQKGSNLVPAALASPTTNEPITFPSPITHQSYTRPQLNHYHQHSSTEPLMTQAPYSIGEPSIHSPPSMHSPQLESRQAPSQRAPSASIAPEPELFSPTMLPAYHTGDYNHDNQYNQYNNNHNVPQSLLFDRPGSSVSSQQQQASALDAFARANRYLIDDTLLEKLRSAGYSPVQKPDTLTLAEWLQHGVTKLEYARLCDAYARYQEQGQAGTSGQ